MTDRDVTIVPIATPPKMFYNVDRWADAVALWDPEPQIALRELGDDAVILDPTPRIGNSII